jgi:cytochrome P450
MLSWALYLISQNPQVEERLYQEATSVIGNDVNALLTSKQVDGLQYTLQVLREALRLYPPAPLYVKAAMKDTTLGAYRIPVSTKVMVNVMSIHRHSKYWVEPLKFNPDRFLPENMAKMHPYQFVPFSAGKRSCIGQAFSLTEAKVFLAKIMLKYHVRLDKSANVVPIEKLTMRPQGLIMTLHARLNTSSNLNVSKINSSLTQSVKPTTDLFLKPSKNDDVIMTNIISISE